MSTISVVIADDHPVVRRGLRALLESQSGLSVVSEAADGLQAVRAVERLQPDVLVLDLMLPGLNGVEVLRVTRQRSPDTHVVVLSMHGGKEFVTEALKNGATGYVLKGCTEENLVRAIRDAAEGKRFLSPPLTQVALDDHADRARAHPIDPHETLTPREREVLQLTAEGKTSPEAGVLLHLSPRTVENHRANLMRKLGLENQSELVRYAVRRGLISVGED